MATLVATKAVDMSNLSELGLFSNFKQLNTPSVTNLSSFTATKGGISMFVTGSHMTAVLKAPSSGTMDGVQVSVNGQLQYAVNNLGLDFGDTQKTFKGNFEPNLFAKADVITGSGANDKLLGYGGKDEVSGRGGQDTMKGGNDSDGLNGGGGGDSIFGDAGNDILDGGGGVDSLTGGAGKDAFLFDNQLNGSNLDTITDFKIGTDVIQLAAAAFPGIGGTGQLASKKFVLSTDYKGQDDVVVYFKATGKIAYEIDGGKLGDAIQFAKVTPGLGLGASDFLIV